MEEPAVEAPGHPAIVRVRAHNPGPMTLTGTNTYVVGSSPAWVIDPGPADRGHIELVREVGETRGGIGGVLLTHSHTDHNAGVEMLGAPRASSATRRASTTSPRCIADRAGGDAAGAGARRRRGRAVHGRSRPRATPPTTSPSSTARWGRSASAATSSSARARRSSRPRRAAARSPTTCVPSSRSPRSARRCSAPATVPGSPTRPRRSPSTRPTAASASASCSQRSGAGKRSDEELLDAAWSDVPEPMRPAAALAMRAHLEKLAAEGRLPDGPRRARPRSAPD